MAWLRSLIERKGGSEITLDNTTYTFRSHDGLRGPHICEVKNDNHIAKLLEIEDGFVLMDEDFAADLAAKAEELGVSMIDALIDAEPALADDPTARQQRAMKLVETALVLDPDVLNRLGTEVPIEQVGDLSFSAETISVPQTVVVHEALVGGTPAANDGADIVQEPDEAPAPAEETADAPEEETTVDEQPAEVPTEDTATVPAEDEVPSEDEEQSDNPPNDADRRRSELEAMTDEDLRTAYEAQENRTPPANIKRETLINALL